MFCTKCGIQNQDSAAFCTKCGSNLSEQTPKENKSSDKTHIYIHPDLDLKRFEIGSIFAKRYEILDQGHVGGMGSVYKCRDTKLHDIVALKVILTKLLDSEHAVSRFRQEVAISRKLHHDNIVEVHDISEDKGVEYFTMEWVEGTTLRSNIQERKKSNKFFSLKEVVEIMSALSDALEYAHQYTIHRDIKPENILISRRNDFQLKLTDFGIAKSLTSSDLTRTNMQMGSPSYMAPEQKIDASNVDKRADIYAMGVILFELLTLENTIGLKLPSETNKELPKEIDTIIKKAVESNPDRRFKDAVSLYKAIKALQKDINGTKNLDIDFDNTASKETILISNKVQKSTSKILILFIVVSLAVGIGSYIYIKKADIFNILKASLESSQPLTKKTDIPGSKIIANVISDSTKVADTQTQIKVESLLSESDKYMISQNYTSPNGKNALLFLREVLYLDPDNQSAKIKLDEIRDIYMKWGQNALSKKDLSKAKQHYNKVLLVSPGFSQAEKQLEDIQKKQQLAISYINKGRDSEQNNQYEKAIDYYNKAKLESQNDEEINELLANVEKRIQEKRTWMLNKNKAEELVNKAKENEYAGNYKQALMDYNSAKKIYPILPEIDKHIITVESKILTEKNRLSKEESISGKMVLVRGGCFKMGDEFGDGARDEKPIHKVCIDDFYIGKNEVTQQQWKEIMGKNPTKFNNCGDSCPVEQVSWKSVQVFIQKLNQMLVHTYRLPTEAEWEFACKNGGGKVKFAGDHDVESVAWFDVNSQMKTHRVGQKIANGLGLNDMNGNVTEWVSDSYSKGYYKISPVKNPKGPSEGSKITARGGSWVDMADSIRCANRYKYAPSESNSYLGFRLARNP